MKFWRKLFGKAPTKRASLAVAAHDRERLFARVGLLAKDDPLWPLLRGWLAENLRIETEAVAKPGIDDGEAHRARGRVGLALDLDAQLEEIWDKSHRAE